MPQPGSWISDARFPAPRPCKSCTLQENILQTSSTICAPNQRYYLLNQHHSSLLVSPSGHGTCSPTVHDDHLPGGGSMRGLFALGIVLLLVGLAVLAWPAIPYTERKKAVDIGPIEVQTETEKHVFVPPLVGIAAAASGVALIALGRRNA